MEEKILQEMLTIYFPFYSGIIIKTKCTETEPSHAQWSEGRGFDQLWYNNKQ